MNMHDDSLRAAIEDAAGGPALTRREDLLASLVARIDAGGADVADAPVPAPALRSVPGGLRRVAARATGIGVGGWVAVAVGSAAAAAGVWLAAAPAPATEPDPVPALSPTASAQPSPSPSPSPSPVVSAGVAVPPLDQPVGEVVRDTLGPVISAVSLLGADGGPVGELLCGVTPTLSVTAQDAAGVESVSLQLTSAGGEVLTIPFARGGGSTWSAVVGPVALVGVVEADVVARDAHGNTATERATPLLSGGCSS